MIYLNKLFKIPGPKDLGMSDNNHAMSMEMFRNNSTEATWEQYYERVKKEYPISFFCASTVPTFFHDLWRDITRKPKKFAYWLKCHVIPKHRYHMIDIRQKGGSYGNALSRLLDMDQRRIVTQALPLSYRYGWIDAPQQMEYALFNILAKFVEEEMPYGYCVPSEEEAAKDDAGDEPDKYSGFRRQLDNHKEYMAIYNYWKVDRIVLAKAHTDALTAWSNARQAARGDQTEEVQLLWKKLNETDEAEKQKLEEMLHRLIDVRGCLWT